MKKILIIPARRHIAEAYSEYLVRYLGDEFDIQIGYPTLNNNSPLAKNADDFDLIYPHFDSHWFLTPEENYAYKVVNVQFEPGGTRFPTVSACTSHPVHESLEHNHCLRFGVDTELFQPFRQPKDEAFHVGFMGNVQTPRRYLKELFMPLGDIPKVKLDIYPTTWAEPREDELERMGGQAVVENIGDGDKWFTGLPNLYNRMDIYVRCDINAGYQFSLLEAASCGVPIVTTDSGVGKEICDEGGGIYVKTNEGDFSENNLKDTSERLMEAVLELNKMPVYRRDVMGTLGRFYVQKEYSWVNWVPKWREFFREGIKNAEKKV